MNEPRKCRACGLPMRILLDLYAQCRAKLAAIDAKCASDTAQMCRTERGRKI